MFETLDSLNIAIERISEVLILFVTTKRKRMETVKYSHRVPIKGS